MSGGETCKELHHGLQVVAEGYQPADQPLTISEGQDDSSCTVKSAR